MSRLDDGTLAHLPTLPLGDRLRVLAEGTPAFLKRCVRAIAQKDGGGRDAIAKGFAICTAQAQKDGRLQPGTQTPTKAGKTSVRSKAAQKGHAGKVQDYEALLAAARAEGRTYDALQLLAERAG